MFRVVISRASFVRRTGATPIISASPRNGLRRPECTPSAATESILTGRPLLDLVGGRSRGRLDAGARGDAARPPRSQPRGPRQRGDPADPGALGFGQRIGRRADGAWLAQLPRGAADPRRALSRLTAGIKAEHQTA